MFGIVVLWGIGSEYIFSGEIHSGVGYLFVLYSAQTALSFLGVILILIFSSLLITSEFSSGTLQMSLVNPVYRFEFFISKIIIGWLFSFILLFIMFFSAFIIGALRFGYRDYVEEGIKLFSKEQMFSEILLCFLVTLIPLLAFSCFGLMISVLTRNVGYSIGISVGSILFLDLIRDRFGLSPFLFQSYIETPFELVKSLTEGFPVSWKPEIYSCLGVPLIWAIGCTAIGLFIFSRKDYKS